MKPETIKDTNLDLLVDYWDKRYEEMIENKMEEVLCDSVGGK